MRERPILFSGPMVCAVQVGQKTQTRRIMKPQPSAGVRRSPFVASGLEDGHGRELRCPYGRPGDRLWVRESHYLTDDGDDEYVVYATDQEAVKAHFTQLDALPADFPEEIKTRHRRLRPSIHMPRWASRITLEVTTVRVQQLQEISEADATEEGVTIEDHHKRGYCSGESLPPAVRAFRDLWESINGDGSWAANPWVWVVEFRRLSGADLSPLPVNNPVENERTDLQQQEQTQNPDGPIKERP